MKKMIVFYKWRSYHVGIAAEAFAAGMFAHAGFDVSVQYGANQPDYDLIVKREDKFLAISVKGSQDGGWGLTQGYLKNGNYHKAVDDGMRNKERKHFFVCSV